MTGPREKVLDLFFRAGDHTKVNHQLEDSHTPFLSSQRFHTQPSQGNHGRVCESCLSTARQHRWPRQAVSPPPHPPQGMAGILRVFVIGNGVVVHARTWGKVLTRDRVSTPKCR